MADLRVLVAHGTKNGSTAEIAEMIGTTLREHGIVADVRPAGDVRDVTEYDAVVLGGALYTNRWHRDAVRFSRRHRGKLADRPVWMFSSGPLDASAAQRRIPPTASARRAMGRLGARDHATFGGRLEDGAKGLIARQILKSGRGGDFRDRGQIRSWADGIATDLAAQPPYTSHAA
ncbi:flavodoxin domain-containing protein [Wenjunlia tyrosinilytica]|uniref:Flavodoxin n=1 Tax=Wenjunlia tyrosinilytica TaxID=1544741 RepID=A0A918E049_9ACTN|nr:flavodoxin domain-containing protein [Wenjunlia tyrosinilytica]GGO92114.1 flavodoxin [Wenjunlia tyrosinilytica]